MVGITSFEAYVPAYRLTRDEISRAWGTRSMGGERAVAKYDEDSLTMGVAATIGCIKRGQQPADGLFFASTTSPYKEKQAAAIMAAGGDLLEIITEAKQDLQRGVVSSDGCIDERLG